MGKVRYMENLKAFLNGLSRENQELFAARCNTSLGYLRKAISLRQQLGAALCVNIERESVGFVRCEELRPDVDWAYLRKSN
jgi:DNA-binding transcriptional regulator YdaS (Cro superfamily)